jgi:hypothetical protein
MRYKRIDYNVIASMIRHVADMRGEAIRLKDAVDDIGRKMNLGIDPRSVQLRLGDQAVEKVEQVGDVRRVTTWVIPKG